VSILSAHGPTLEQIADLVGHSGTRVTEQVYRKQLRPVPLDGATAMDKILPARRSMAEGAGGADADDGRGRLVRHFVSFIDGQFGQNTRLSTTLYQVRHPETGSPDGIVGSQTWLQAWWQLHQIGTGTHQIGVPLYFEWWSGGHVSFTLRFTPTGWNATQSWIGLWEFEDCSFNGKD
jgi:hypothetical protein